MYLIYIYIYILNIRVFFVYCRAKNTLVNCEGTICKRTYSVTHDTRISFSRLSSCFQYLWLTRSNPLAVQFRRKKMPPMPFHALHLSSFLGAFWFI